MKKLLLILAALAVTSSAVLTACNQKPVENVKTPENEVVDSAGEEEKNANEEKEPAFVPEVGEGEVVEYNTAIENAVAEFEPKNEIDNEILGTINGLPISAAQAKYAAGYTAYREVVEGITGDELKDVASNTYIEYATVVSLAKAYGVELDESLKNYISSNITAMKEYFNAEGQIGYENYFLDVPFTPHFYHLQNLIYQYIYQQTYFKFCEDEAVKAKASESALNFYEENDFVRAKHILVMFPAGEGENGEISDAQKEETRKKANDILKEVKAMKDISEFDALIGKYNEDPGVQANPNGYYFGKGEMVPEFETAAYELEVGETSDVVETSYGCHILLKLPFDDDKIYESPKFNEFTTEQFYSMMDEQMAAEYDIVFADNYSERFTQFMDEYKKVLEKQAAEAEKAAAENTAE